MTDHRSELAPEPTLQIRMPASPTTPTVAHPASTILGQRLDQQAAFAERAGLPLSGTDTPQTHPSASRRRLQLVALFGGVIAIAAIVGAAAALLLRGRG